MISFDPSGLVTKLFNVALDILFPERGHDRTQIEIKRLENEGLEIKCKYEERMEIIVRVSEKWEREHLERMVILQIIQQANALSGNTQLTERERIRHQDRADLLIRTFEEHFRTTLTGFNLMALDHEAKIGRLGL